MNIPLIRIHLHTQGVYVNSVIVLRLYWIGMNLISAMIFLTSKIRGLVELICLKKFCFET